MAKRSRNQNAQGTNKSEAIRQALKDQPKAPVKDVVAVLAAKGIQVTPTFVYYVRSRQRRQARLQKRQQLAQNTAKAGLADPVKLILQVRTLAKNAGGIKNLKQLVDALAE